MKMLTTSAALGGEQLLMGCLQSVPSIPLARDTYSSRCTQGPSALVREASFLVFNGLHASHRGMQKAFDSESILLGHLTDTRKARCGVGWWRALKKTEVLGSLQSLGSERGRLNLLSPVLPWSDSLWPHDTVSSYISPNLSLCSGGWGPVEPKEGKKKDLNWGAGDRGGKRKGKEEKGILAESNILNVLRAPCSLSQACLASLTLGGSWRI